MWGRASSAPQGSQRLAQHQIRFGAGLAERRRARRRTGRIIFLILLLTLLAAVLYGLNRPEVRVANITVVGLPESASVNARNAMNGSYFSVIPRDSFFFFPENKIRADILSSDGSIAAVSITRNGLTGITIKADTRVPIARWCGLSPTPEVDEYCYVFDANGFIFSAFASSTETLNAFKFYAPLAGGTEEPLRATITSAEKLPSVFDFARQLATLGSPVTKIVTRDNGEIDDYLESGSRITYLLDNEQSAFTALVSARDTMNLSDGSIDYVDLRFDGKVYVKRK